MKIFKAFRKLFSHLLEEKTQNNVEIFQNSQEDFNDYEIDNPYINQAREWAMDKIGSLRDHKNASAIASEFDEWINISNENEMEYIYLEDEQWTDEQEIDIKE
jgi:hypothetical protein